MNRGKLAEGCFLLAVICGLAWLGAWVALGGLTIFASQENEPMRKAVTFVALTAELPMVSFGWLYQKLKR